MTENKPKNGRDAEDHNGAGPTPRKPPMVSSGNPRITVAFPFSKIDIHEPDEALRAVATTLARLADQVAKLAAQVAPDAAAAANEVAAEASALAQRLADA